MTGASPRWHTLCRLANDEALNTFTLPSYGRGDLVLFYRQSHQEAALNFKNYVSGQEGDFRSSFSLPLDAVLDTSAFSRRTHCLHHGPMKRMLWASHPLVQSPLSRRATSSPTGGHPAPTKLKAWLGID